MSIPLNNIVKINPGVLDVGNNGNNLFGLMLIKQDLKAAEAQTNIQTEKATEAETGTAKTAQNFLAFNQTTTITNADQIAELFGENSKEHTLAKVYFSGFNNSDRVAAQLYIAPYYVSYAPSSVIGKSISNLTLQNLRDFTGDLSVTLDTLTYCATDIDLTEAKSFSDAAEKLTAALFGTVDPVASITYSSANRSMIVTANAFEVENIVVEGSLAELLRLDEKNGVFSKPVISEDQEDTPHLAELLNTLRQTNLAFCSVFLNWDADKAEKDQLAMWANSMKDDVCVILNDTDPSALDASTVNTSKPDPEKLSFAEIVAEKGYEGVVCVYDNPELCAFIAGYAASWDLTKTDGRFTAAFRRSPLLTANVNDEKIANTLKAKGYNFYGVWASSTSNFTFMYEGRISGQYLWLDSWFCQVWMRRQFQYYFMMTLLARGQIPYNTDGKGILTTAIKPAIDQFMNFGAIRPGISLADEQIQALKQAGLNQSQINSITTIGYYLKVDMARVSPETRVKRGSPPIDFWYTDGQSVQQINMNSIEIQ